MSDRTLRKAIIRLAHAKPELRDHLLPLVSKQAGGWEKKLISDLQASFEAGEASVLWNTVRWQGKNKHDLGNGMWVETPESGSVEIELFVSNDSNVSIRDASPVIKRALRGADLEWEDHQDEWQGKMPFKTPFKKAQRDLAHWYPGDPSVTKFLNGSEADGFFTLRFLAESEVYVDLSE